MQRSIWPSLTESLQRPCQTAAALTFWLLAAAHGGDVGSSGLAEDGKALVRFNR